MEIIYSDEAREDIEYWKKTKNIKIQLKISELLHSITETPFLGIGKPEPLKHKLRGKWSRRINSEHRVIYSISESYIIIHSLRGHYV